MMIRVLPNRYIALLMTPREASLLEGQILDPGQFPWQDTEAEITAQGVKAMLHDAVGSITARELDASIDAIHKIEEVRREALNLVREDRAAPEETPDTGETPAPEEGPHVKHAGGTA